MVDSYESKEPTNEHIHERTLDNEVAETVSGNVIEDRMNKNNPTTNEKAIKVKNDDEEEDGGVDGWTDILGSGDLLKKTLKTGNGERPVAGQIVRVRIETRAKGTSTKDEFVLGHGFVSDASEMVISLMSPGEVCAVKVGSRFVEIDADKNDKTMHEYKMELLDVRAASTMATRERIDRAREEGNKQYNVKQFERAVRLYDYGLAQLDADNDDDGDEEGALNDDDNGTTINWQLTLLSNKAAALIKMERWQEVVDTTAAFPSFADKAVDGVILTKLLLRRAEALMSQRDYTAAQATIATCLKNNATNKHAKQLLDKANNLRMKEENKMKNTYKNMLKALGEEDAKRTTSFGSLFSGTRIKWAAAIISGVCALIGVAIHFYSTTSAKNHDIRV